jgi:phosphatidylglycerophosphate synthase
MARPCGVAYDRAQTMNESQDNPLPALLPAAWPEAHRLAVSAVFISACVGAALLLGASLLARVLPAGGGNLYVYKAVGCYFLLLLPLLAGLRAHLPHDRFGAANTVTLLRAAMVCLLASLYGEQWSGEELLVAAIAVVALSMDGVDGWLARRGGTQSRFGARFDMEADALLVLVLALLAWQSGKAGVWVLSAGLMRYAFVAATLRWRWLDRPLPHSQRRKTICVLEIVALIACVAPILPDAWRTAAAVDAVLMVGWSFAVDIAWLVRRRRLPMSPLPTTRPPPSPPPMKDGTADAGA